MHAIPEPLVARLLGEGQGSAAQPAAQLARAERQTLRQIKRWLNAMEIERFKDLESRAWSHHYQRESRQKKGLARLLLRLRAVLTCPNSRSAWKELGRG